MTCHGQIYNNNIIIIIQFVMRQVLVSQIMRGGGRYATAQFALIPLFLGIYHNLQPTRLRVALLQGGSIKYPTRQHAISPQSVVSFQKFLKLLNPNTSVNLSYTMYPLHLNYTTTLLCKIITMKITIFHRGIFW